VPQQSPWTFQPHHRLVGRVQVPSRRAWLAAVGALALPALSTRRKHLGCAKRPDFGTWCASRLLWLPSIAAKAVVPRRGESAPARIAWQAPWEGCSATNWGGDQEKSTRTRAKDGIDESCEATAVRDSNYPGMTSLTFVFFFLLTSEFALYKETTAFRSDGAIGRATRGDHARLGRDCME